MPKPDPREPAPEGSEQESAANRSLTPLVAPASTTMAALLEAGAKLSRQRPMVKWKIYQGGRRSPLRAQGILPELAHFGCREVPRNLTAEALAAAIREATRIAKVWRLAGPGKDALSWCMELCTPELIEFGIKHVFFGSREAPEIRVDVLQQDLDQMARRAVQQLGIHIGPPTPWQAELEAAAPTKEEILCALTAYASAHLKIDLFRRETDSEPDLEPGKLEI